MAYAHNLAREIDVFQTWIRDMEEKPEIDSPEEAYAVIRAVLQTLRDRLLPEEAAHLSAQLPLIARGIYYEGWRPSRTPEGFDLQQFYDKVRERLNGQCGDVDPGRLARSVFEVMALHVDPGEIRHVQGSLPKDMKSLIPEELPA